MKRFSAFSMLLAMMLILSGCTSSVVKTQKLDPDMPITIEVWHYYNGPQKTAFDNMVVEFNETIGLERGIIVDAFSQGDVHALSQKVLSAARHEVGSDPLPALFFTYADTAFELDKLGMLVDLDNYFVEEELSTYRQEFISEGRFPADGSLKIFPVAKSVELMMINLTDWNRFSTDTDAQLSSLSTMEGVVKTAEAYYDWSGGKAFFGRDAMANYMIIGSQQLGLELLTRDCNRTVIQTDKTILRTLWDNYYVPLVNGWFSSNGRFRSDEANLGDIISLVGSSSATAYFPTEVAFNDYERYPIEIAILPAPHFEGAQPFAIQQGAGVSVVKATPMQEYASTLFLKWLTDSEQNIRFATASGGYLPVTTEALDLEAITVVLDETLLCDPALDRMRQTFSASLEVLNGNTLYTPRPSAGNIAVRAVLEQSMNDWAKCDYGAIRDLVDQGTSHDEAVALFDTDENFENWCVGLIQKLNQSVQ